MLHQKAMSFKIKMSINKNINQIISTVGHNGYVVAQQYIPAAKGGDKRLLLLRGQPIRMGKQVAVYGRLSPKGEIRSNIRIGGTRRRISFTDEDARVAELLGPRLQELGLYIQIRETQAMSAGGRSVFLSEIDALTGEGEKGITITAVGMGDDMPSAVKEAVAQWVLGVLPVLAHWRGKH